MIQSLNTTTEKTNEELIRDLESKKADAVASDNFEEAIKIRDEINKLKNKEPSEESEIAKNKRAFEIKMKTEKHEKEMDLAKTEANKEKNTKMDDLMAKLNGWSEIITNTDNNQRRIPKELWEKMTEANKKRRQKFEQGVWQQEETIKNDNSAKNSIDFTNKKIELNEWEINAGNLEVAQLPNTVVDKFIGEGTDVDGNTENINVYINNPKLNWILLSRNGNYLFRWAQARFFVLAKVGDFYLPFYISSAGTSGKKQWKRYPFFGFTGNWLVKPYVVPSTLKEAQKDWYTSIEDATQAYRKYSWRNVNPWDFVYFKNDNTKAIEEITNAQNLLNDNLQIPAKYMTVDWKIKSWNDTYFDINDFTKFEYDKDWDNKEWAMSKIWFNPKNVYNNWEWSSDNRMKDIITLVENNENVSKKEPALSF